MNEIHFKRVIASGTVITHFGLSFIFLFIHNVVPFKNSFANKRDKFFINSLTYSTGSFKQWRPSLITVFFHLHESVTKQLLKIEKEISRLHPVQYFKSQPEFRGFFSSKLKYNVSTSYKWRVLSMVFVKESQWSLNVREIKNTEYRQNGQNP